MESEEIAVLSAVQSVDDVDALRAVEALAAAKARNIELKRENERLLERIAQEGERLEHA